jgi:hypothetical protein
MDTSGFANTMKRRFDTGGKLSCRLEPNPTAQLRA